MYRIIGAATGLMVVLSFGWVDVVAAQTSPVWRYRLTVEPREDRTDVVVDAEISGVDDQAFAIGLPRDCYGSPDLYTAVSGIEGLEGSQVSPGADAAHRTLTAGSDGVVRVRYRLSYDPVLYGGYAFGPNTGPAHLHLGGCQWMLAPADEAAPFDYEIGFAEKPEGWTLYSSLAADAATASGHASYEDLASTALGGGTSHRRLGTAQGPVDIFIADSPEMNESRALDAVETIVRAQRDRFGAEGQEGFYIVSINPRPGVLAGTAIDHLFVTFVRPDASQGELLNLIAHEMFHNEVPNRLDVLPPEGMTRVVFEWFSEGIAEFGARRLMLETGLIDAEGYAGLFNDDLERIRFSPVRSASAAELMEAARSRRFGASYKKLAYYRGALMALDWDTRLRRAGHADGLFHLLDVLRARRKADNRIPAEVLFAESAALGLDVRGDYERFIVRGERLTVPADVLGPDYRLIENLKPSRDLGFDLLASQATKVIIGVRPTGPAYAAGLRDGMTLVRTQNAFTDINGAKLHEPVVLDVTVGEETLQIAYSPQGPQEPALALVPTSRGDGSR